MLSLKTVVSTSVVFCVLGTLPLFAVRRPDVPSSQNGEETPTSCPNSTATPFFATLDGTTVPPSACTPSSDPNKPNPPATYPNLQVTLAGQGFTVTITPALWENGISAATTKHTVLWVQFAGQPGMTLQSLVIKANLNNAAYVPCFVDPISGEVRGIPFCTSNTMLDQFGDPVALEPAPIDLANYSSTTTRWDFNGFVQGSSPLALLVSGFPSEFAKIDKFPSSNQLTAASFASANFLATVTDASNNVLTAGGLTLMSAPAAKNDLFSSAIKITKVPYKTFVDVTATSPTEVLVAPPAPGSMLNPQGDPIPQDPALANPGTPCKNSWSTGTVFRSVWYAFTPSISDNYSVTTSGSSYDTGIYVFTGTPQDTSPPLPPLSPTPVACNDDSPTLGVNIEYSYVNFAATAGTTYYIMVSEVPPIVGTDSTGTIPLAAPLATLATLKLELNLGSSIVFSGESLPPSWVMNFPSTAVGSTSSLTITATNTTSTTTNIVDFTIVNSGAHDFSQTNTCGTSLGPGGQCNITLTFKPLATTSYTANLVMHINGGANPATVTLNGTGF